MASIEVMKERARIAGRFNLSARRVRKVADGKPVIIVTETEGNLSARLFNADI